jgi:hypothetical protein
MDALSKRVDLDLRRATRLVHDAFALAIQTGEMTGCITVPKHNGKGQIGFI